MRIRTKFFLILAIPLFLVSLASFAWRSFDQRTALFNQIDNQLFMTASLARRVVGIDFHDSINGPQSLTKEIFLSIVNENNNICIDFDIQYVFSLLEFDDNIVFTSSTSPDHNVENLLHAGFFDQHSNPEAYRKVFDSMEPQYQTNTDEWGSVRTVLLPFRDRLNRKYLFGAAMTVSDLTELNQKMIVSTLYNMLGIIIYLLIFSGILSNLISKPFKKLSNSFDDKQKNKIFIIPIEEVGTYEEVDLIHHFNLMGERINEALEDLSATLNSIADGVVTTDLEGRISDMNPSAEIMSGWSFSEIRGRKINETFAVVHEYSANHLVNVLNQAVELRTPIHNNKPCILFSKKGREYYIEDTVALINHKGVKPDGVVFVFRDVTERRRLEEMMVQSEKMLSIGGLAAGLAHEINNPLAGMMQTSSVLKDRLTRTDISANLSTADELGVDLEKIHAYMDKRKIFSMIDQINDSGRRAADIIQNMLNFARKDESVFSGHSLESLLESTIKLLQMDYNLKKHYDFRQIEIVREYAESLPLVNCEEGNIQQVLLNILKNGAEAMFESGLSSDKDGFSPRFILRIFSDDKSDSDEKVLCIEIEDNGPGMTEDVYSHIFDPFFTTKPSGKGTGLGLSVSYFIIVENHGGEMSVTSSPGEGTKFTIKLKAVI